jgi:hypothetical protein
MFANDIGNPRIGYSWREPGTCNLYHLLRTHDGDEKEKFFIKKFIIRIRINLPQRHQFFIFF